MDQQEFFHIKLPLCLDHSNILFTHIPSVQNEENLC